MKCHKCPIVKECADLTKTIGIKLPASDLRFCPLLQIVTSVFAGLQKAGEEIKKAEAEKAKGQTK